jgi:hypothetical protein
MTSSNIQPAYDAVLKELEKLGATEGEGSMSRSKAAIRLAEAAREGVVDEDDAKEAYAVYQSGSAKVGMNKSGPKPDASLVDNSTKVQVSKFRQIIKMGALPVLNDPFDSAAVMLKRATDIANTLRGNEDGPKVKSPFDAMLDVARAQLETPEVKLIDEQITACVCKPETKDKGELEKLAAAYKSLYKIAADYPRPETDLAVADLKAAIVEAGGEVPAMTKEEKEAAQAMAFLAKRGMIAVGALAAPVRSTTAH